MIALVLALLAAPPNTPPAPAGARVEIGGAVGAGTLLPFPLPFGHARAFAEGPVLAPLTWHVDVAADLTPVPFTFGPISVDAALGARLPLGEGADAFAGAGPLIGAYLVPTSDCCGGDPKPHATFGGVAMFGVRLRLADVRVHIDARLPVFTAASPAPSLTAIPTLSAGIALGL